MLCETIAALALLQLWQRPSFAMAIWLWVGVAAGALAKGPPVVILTLGMIGLMWLATLLGYASLSRKAAWWQVLWGVIVLLGLLPLLYWGHLCWQRDNGVFITWLWDWYVSKRAGGAVWGQTGPPGYHLVVMGLSLLVVLPWYLGWLRSMWTELRTGSWRGQWSAISLWVWLIPGWFFYELQLSKLPSYAMGAYGAFVLGVAMFIHTPNAKLYKWSQYVQVGVLGLLAVACLALAGYGLGQALNPVHELGFTLFTSLSIFGGVLATGYWGWLAWGSLPGGIVQLDKHLLLMVMVLGMMPWAVGLLEPSRAATRQVAARLGDLHQRGMMGPVLLCNNYGTPSLPFYLELDGFEMVHEEGVEPALAVLKAGQPRLMVMEPERWAIVKHKADSLGISVPLKVEQFRGIATDRADGAKFTLVQVAGSPDLVLE